MLKIKKQTTNMKKAIFLIGAALICMTAFAQKPETKPAPKSDTVYVDLSKAKVIVFKDSASENEPVKILPAKELGKGYVVIGDRQYWYNLLLFMKGSKNGNFSQQETENLQLPFYEFAAEWERIVQSMQQPKK